MLFLMLLGCAAEPYANCTVGIVTHDDEGTLLGEERVDYDEAGHVIVYRSETDESVTEEIATWRGDCPVHETQESVAGGNEGSVVIQRTCDDFDDVTREESSEETRADGELVDLIASVTTYENEQDAEGRLVHVLVREDDGGELDVTYTWGECDDPVRTEMVGPDDHVVQEVTCRDDGQFVEKTIHWIEADRTVTTAITRTYDDAGHWIHELVGDGEGDMTIENVATWDDPEAPGPTVIEQLFEGDLWTRSTFTYDCPG